MKKLLIYLFLIFILLGNSFFNGWGAAPAELRDSIDRKSKELQEINDKIKESQRGLEEIQSQSRTLEREVKSVNQNINQANLSIRSGEIAIDKLKLEIESIHYDIADIENEISSKEKAVVKILQEFQQREAESMLIIFLRNKSLAESVFEVQSLTDFGDSLSTEVGALKNTKIALAGKLEETSGKKTTMEMERENLKNRKMILDDLKKDKQTILTQTKNQEQIYQKIIGDLEKKQAEIAAEIEKLEEELKIAFDPNVLPTKRPQVLGHPVSSILITQEYGATAFASRAYKTKLHNGIDFKAPIGTPILSAEDGEVVAVGNNGQVQYGRYILIKHQNNLATLYAHLSREIVKKGDAVKRGQIIGYSGNTGYSTGPHLHFGVYWRPSVTLKSFSGAGLIPVGVTINPADYL